MIHIDIEKDIHDIKGHSINQTITETSPALALICSAAEPENEGIAKQEQIEAVIYSMIKATKDWLDMLGYKDVDVKRIGVALNKIK